jgi:uncharacterized damage-inducible protein DinB
MSQTISTLPTVKDLLLAQLDREAVLTRKAIERVPEGRNDFKPHLKSMELGYLAALVAAMPGWIPLITDRDELNLDDPSNGVFRTKAADTNAELIANFEIAMTAGRQALEATTEERLMGQWGFKMRGMEFPRQARHVAIADSVFSHLAHHRGQLTVYLRLNEAAVPALYGPSADEQV